MPPITFRVLILAVTFYLKGASCAPAPTSFSPQYVTEGNETYMVIDDMLIRQNPERAGLTNKAWPNGVVPFSFDASINADQRKKVLQAFNAITSSVSCVTFRAKQPSDNYNLYFNNNKTKGGCSSAIGWQNKVNQYIQIDTSCSIGNIVHETIHALGFYHEHTRNDRDKYVTINWDNIIDGQEHNFVRNDQLNGPPSTSYYGVAYNYDSIMHYGATFFSVNGENTIDVLNNPRALGSGDNIGQRDYISRGDEQMIRAKYNCPAEAGESDGCDETSEGCGEKPMWPEEGSTTKNPKCEKDPTLPECRGEQ